MKFSNRMDPNSWKPDGGSFWCPSWAQPFVMWIIRKAERVRAAFRESVTP